MPTDVLPLIWQEEKPPTNEEKLAQQTANDNANLVAKHFVEKPNVTHLVRKVNELLSPKWQENEMRCGRYLAVDGSSPEEIEELCAVFQTFESIVHFENSKTCITFKPKKQNLKQGRPRNHYEI